MTFSLVFSYAFLGNGGFTSAPHPRPCAADPCFWDPGFPTFFIVFSAPPHEGQNGHGRSPGRGQEDQMCTKGLQNGGKREVRAAPASAPARRSCKKGCNVQSVHYLLCFKHIGPARKSRFFTPAGTLKRRKNEVCVRGRQRTLKTRGKGRRRAENGGHVGARGSARDPKMTPKVFAKT